MSEFVALLSSNYHLFVTHYGLEGMFVMLFIESAGIPLPIQPAYLAGQMLIDNGQSSVLVVSFVLYLGQMVGSLITYYAGRRIGYTMKSRAHLNATQKKIASWFDKFGAPTIFVARVTGYVRPWTSYVAGIAEVKFWPFFIYTSLGAIVLNAVCLAFSKQFIFLWDEYELVRVLVITSFSVGLGVIIWKATRPGQTSAIES